MANQAANPHHQSLPSTETPHITPLNPSHGFLPPAPPNVGGSGMRGLASNKPSEISNPASRIQQSTPSIAMHPTFRSDFNVSLRYFFVRFLFIFPLLLSLAFVLMLT